MPVLRESGRGWEWRSHSAAGWRRLARGLVEWRCRTWLLAVLSAGVLEIVSQPTREYTIKAVFIFHFTQFVDWPATAFSESATPFVIGIVGSNPFDGALQEVVQNEKAKGRKIMVEEYRTVADIRSCQLIYVHPSMAGRLQRVLERVKDKPILTVSDIPDFAAKGGMIELVTGAKVRLRINLEAARAVRLEISTKLLRLAEIYQTGGDGGERR